MANLSNLNHLRSSWQLACKPYNTAFETGEKYFNEIVEKYSEPHRFYHNTMHLKDLLLLFEKHKNQLQSPELVLFTIFYHDIIYNPQQNNNEQASALLAAQRLSELGLPDGEVQTVCEIILGSQHHLKIYGLPADSSLFFDFDLAILGSDWERYQNYSQAIRKEYQIYPDELYFPGRKKVLEKLLSRKQIFQTDTFVEAFEAQARTNLKQEIWAIGEE